MNREIELPFPGFYESELSALLEDAVELLEYEYAIDWKKARAIMTAEYVLTFRHIAFYRLHRELPIEFARIDSPREYNFTNDRLFVNAPLAFVRVMRGSVNLETLSEVIKERHTSYSGFWSFYSNDIADWLDKPIDEWDANETGTLLRAYLRDAMEIEGETPDSILSELLDNMHEAGMNAIAQSENKS